MSDLKQIMPFYNLSQETRPNNPVLSYYLLAYSIKQAEKLIN